LQQMSDMGIAMDIDDMGQACVILYRTYAPGLPQSLGDTVHYSRLISLGFEEDVRYCFSKDSVPVIGCYINSVIRQLT